MDKIYLDYAATTPVDPRVLDVMIPYFNEEFGNPSSIHRFGQKAESAIETAREITASVINCDPEEVIFTSCGSESDNLAIRGAAFIRKELTGANYIAASRTEHHAVSKTVEQLGRFFGFEVGWLPTDENGMVNPSIVNNMTNSKTGLVSVMYANNEIGTINPIAKIGEICREKGVIFHSDAVQAAAYLPIDVKKLNVDLLSLGGHKFYAPKGVGALYIRKGTKLTPTQTGGSQEFGLRAGTQNVPYIVGFAEALRLTNLEREDRIKSLQPLRDKLIGSVLETIPESKLTGHLVERLPNHASFVFKHVDGNLLLTLLDASGFACSSGSACKTGNPEPSEVMTTIGLDRTWGLGSLRITLGTKNTPDQIDSLLQVLPKLVEQARSFVRK